MRLEIQVKDKKVYSFVSRYFNGLDRPNLHNQSHQVGGMDNLNLTQSMISSFLKAMLSPSMHIVIYSAQKRLLPNLKVKNTIFS